MRAIQEITLNDAKKAVDVAWELYKQAQKNVFEKKMTLDNKRQIIVRCRFAGGYGTRFDCGLTPGYQMRESNYGALKTWFKKTYPQVQLRPPQTKPNGNRMVNAYVGNFNFHLDVGRFKTLMNLLSRLLQSAMRARE